MGFRNILLTITSLFILIYVSDHFWTKYNLDPSEATCTNQSVESTWEELITKDLKKNLSEQGFALDFKILKENTYTLDKKVVFKGHSIYSCSTTVELSLRAENTFAKSLIKLIPPEDLVVSEDSDYQVAPNDLGTTFIVKGRGVSKNEFDSLLNEAASKLKNTCSSFQSLITKNIDESNYEKNIENIKEVKGVLEQQFTECAGTIYEITKSDYETKMKSLQDALNVPKDQWVKDHKISLPFIGKARFSFSGGNGSEDYIVIKENGNTEVGTCGKFRCSVSYTGKFKEIMEGYTFTSTTVSMVSESGSIVKICDESGTRSMDEYHSCTTSLYFDYQNEPNTKKVNISQDVLDNYAYELLGGTYTTNDLGGKLWSTTDLVKKTNSKGVKIYCLSYKNVCKSEAEVIAYFNQSEK